MVSDGDIIKTVEKKKNLKTETFLLQYYCIKLFRPPMALFTSDTGCDNVKVNLRKELLW